MMVWGDIFEVLGIVKRTVIASQIPGELVKLDCTVSENYQYTSNLTQYPIEDGSVLNDHIIKNPVSITLTGIVSDNPIELFSVVGRVARMIQRSGRPSKVAHEVIKRLERRGTLLNISTSLDVFENMVITSYTPIKNNKNTNSLEFTMTLQQVDFASIRFDSLGNAKDADKVNSKKTQGNKPAKPAGADVAAKAQNKSVAAGILDSTIDFVFGGFLQ